MNKEVHYEGWLIKSPPTKRIWRARWRRRWFTLKQGEIPEQFCLEYYTDRNCRKLKGVIDLDQCEQVDCGLRLENRKQKFQFMFDIKTPRRTYYLAADTEADMRDWVNCICQVCHLHDTKQSSDLQEESRTQNTVASGLTNTVSSSSSSSNNTNNTTTTSLNSSGAVKGPVVLGQSINSSNEILRRPPVTAIDQQPLSSGANISLPAAAAAATYQNNDCAYVNTEYTNRETIMCEVRLDRKPHTTATASTTTTAAAAAASAQNHPTPASPGAAALYLNSPVFHMHDNAARLAVNSNGVVRKIPENLVLNNTPLSDSQQNSVQPSPALSTASGPYIPISECFSGSPKFLVDSNNSTMPLNNLDPKFYDTPRSHNNIGLNLTNDQSYSPKITNCGTLQQPTPAKTRSGRSDSDSESVFTDDEEWTHPMPLRENVDRSTRPSDSSVENESFVYTYSQRFSKLPDDGSKEEQSGDNTPEGVDPLDKLAKVLKNKNNLILDMKEQEKAPREFPQFSDTENTSPAIGPRDAKSVVEESYDIPRSHNLPYHNMGQLFEKVTSPEVNPIAASTPNLMANAVNNASEPSPSNVRTLPRPHCYTNAAPSKVEGNVFSYDFMEQPDCPPVNRKLKPKISLEDKPPEEVPAKPPVNQAQLQQISPHNLSEGLTKKLLVSNMQNTAGNRSPGATAAANVSATDHIPLQPPSVDRKLKPSAYKLGNSATIGSSVRRSTGAPLSMVLCNEHEGASYIMETRTLPRHPRPPNYTVTPSGTFNVVSALNAMNTAAVSGLQIQHQRAASAAAALQMAHSNFVTMHLPLRNEHKLQYFDLDVANPPPTINRQSMSVGNLNAGGSGLGRFGLSADPSARAPVKSSVVYNSVDFVKTEAFKRIREERKKESESVQMMHK